MKALGLKRMEWNGMEWIARLFSVSLSFFSGGVIGAMYPSTVRTTTSL